MLPLSPLTLPPSLPRKKNILKRILRKTFGKDLPLMGGKALWTLLYLLCSIGCPEGMSVVFSQYK